LSQAVIGVDGKAKKPPKPPAPPPLHLPPKAIKEEKPEAKLEGKEFIGFKVTGVEDLM